MDGLLPILRANPGLVVMAVLGGLAALVLVAIAAILARSGASLRPVAFVAVFIAIIVLPQCVGHLAMAVRPSTSGASPADGAGGARVRGGAPPPPALRVEGGRFADPATLFGADVDPALVSDARTVFPEFLAGARHAELAIVPTGETILAAVFEDDASAARAAEGYVRYFKVEWDQGAAGRRGRRPVSSDLVEIARADRALFAFTSRDAAALRRRVDASAPVIAGLAPASAAAAAPDRAASREPLVPALQPLARFFRPTWRKVLGAGLLVLVATVWFFRGVTWASTRPAEPVAVPASWEELRARLLSVNAVDVPIAVHAREGSDEVEVTWRYADARWLDLARARGLRRTHRLVLTPDPGRRAVRVREYAAAFDASAGRGGASLSWRIQRGVTFFEVDRRRVFGLQFGPDGRPTGRLDYAYRFDLQELKGPFEQAVTRAGWSWKPVLLDVSGR